LPPPCPDTDSAPEAGHDGPLASSRSGTTAALDPVGALCESGRTLALSVYVYGVGAFVGLLVSLIMTSTDLGRPGQALVG